MPRWCTRWGVPPRLGHLGVWWSGRWPDDPAELAEVVHRLVAAGYRTLWRSGGFAEGLDPGFGHLLGAHPSVTVASGIHSIWTTPAKETAQARSRLAERHGDRFLLGLGVSHAEIVDPSGRHYEHPYRAMAAYLDGLDQAEPPVSADCRVLAALGERMLDLAAQRSAGAHPYFVPVEHTAAARERLGPGPLLAPEVAVVLEEDAAEARRVARSHSALYLGLRNYVANLARLGFSEKDLAGAGSDRLVDAVVAWGDEAAVADRVREHLDAGADHVCLQVLNGGFDTFPLPEYELVASSLLPP